GTHGSVLAVPLHSKDRTIGVLFLSDTAAHEFSEREVHLAQAFADQAALALDNARLHEDAEGGRRYAEELARLARSLTETLDSREVCTRIVERVPELFRVAASTLRLLRPDGGLEAAAYGGTRWEQLTPGDVLPAASPRLTPSACKPWPIRRRSRSTMRACTRRPSSAVARPRCWPCWRARSTNRSTSTPCSSAWPRAHESCRPATWRAWRCAIRSLAGSRSATGWGRGTRTTAGSPSRPIGVSPDASSPPGDRSGPRTGWRTRASASRGTSWRWC